MKILSIGYNTVLNGKGTSGRERLLLTISKKLINDGIEVNAYFSRVKGKNENFIRPISSLFRIVIFILNIYFYLLQIPTYKRRHYSEILFDLILEKRIKQCHDIIITTNPWIPKTAKRAKLYNIQVLLLTGNPSDNLIFNLIKEEKKKIGLENNIDAFDSTCRLNKFNKFSINVDKVIAINPYTAQTFKDDKHFSNSNIFQVNLVQVVSDQTDVKVSEKNNNISSNLKIFFLAHSTVLKGLHYLLNAIIQVNKINKINVKLWVGGSIDAAFRDYLDKTFLEIDDNVKFLGPLNTETKNWYYNNCDIFVCPSLIDMSPVTIFEAMTNHKPVILTENCGNKWIIQNGVNGFVIKQQSSNDLVKVLKWCSENKKKLLSMGDLANNSYQKALLQNNLQIDKIISFIKAS